MVCSFERSILVIYLIRVLTSDIFRFRRDFRVHVVVADTACSMQWRENSDQVDSGEVEEMAIGVYCAAVWPCWSGQDTNFTVFRHKNNSYFWYPSKCAQFIQPFTFISEKIHWLVFIPTLVVKILMRSGLSNYSVFSEITGIEVCEKPFLRKQVSILSVILRFPLIFTKGH